MEVLWVGYESLNKKDNQVLKVSNCGHAKTSIELLMTDKDNNLVMTILLTKQNDFQDNFGSQVGWVDQKSLMNTDISVWL